MRTLNIGLVESEAKVLLEALIEKETKMSGVCASSDDEDEIADVGNDLIEVRLLLNRLKEEAVSTFGESVMVFDRTPL